MAERGPKVGPKLEIVRIVERLEAMTSSATKLPLTKRAVINPREIQEMVSQIRNSLPSDINEALQIIRYRDTIISQAQTDANRMRTKAEQESMQKVSETQIVKDSRKKAEEVLAAAQQDRRALLAEAENQAKGHIEGADHYAIDVLSRLEQELSALLFTAQRGIESLKEGKVLGDVEG